uniref:Uncharacterized protein n=1 Tax=Rhipicephalus zambeziensis TaxID=60191 RepID=A0A224YLV5_9ACAR
MVPQQATLSIHAVGFLMQNFCQINGPESTFAGKHFYCRNTMTNLKARTKNYKVAQFRKCVYVRKSLAMRPQRHTILNTEESSSLNKLAAFSKSCTLAKMQMRQSCDRRKCDFYYNREQKQKQG